MSDRELRKMIEYASGFVEKRFAETGEILPMWHVITEDGQQLVLPMPPIGKDVAAAIIRKRFKDTRAVRFLFIDETWAAKAHGEKEMAELTAWMETHDGLSDYPNRIELIVFSAEDRDGRILMAERCIVREINSKPRLGPLKIHEDIVEAKGRFIGMLPPQGTKQ